MYKSGDIASPLRHDISEREPDRLTIRPCEYCILFLHTKLLNKSRGFCIFDKRSNGIFCLNWSTVQIWNHTTFSWIFNSCFAVADVDSHHMRGGGGAVAVEPDSGCGVVRARPAVAVATPQVLICTLYSTAHIYLYLHVFNVYIKKHN